MKIESSLSISADLILKLLISAVFSQIYRDGTEW